MGILPKTVIGRTLLLSIAALATEPSSIQGEPTAQAYTISLKFPGVPIIPHGVFPPNAQRGEHGGTVDRDSEYPACSAQPV